MRFGGKEYPDDLKLSEFVKHLEKEEGFRLISEQFKRLLGNEELSAQEIIDLC